MGKTEMSSVLKNLKFMQRAVQKEEKIKEEKPESKPDGNFIPPSNVIKKCMVIFEGEPQPGTVRGRMSFQNFNPSIDKLREEEAANGHQTEASTSSLFRSGMSNERENQSSEHTGMDVDDNDNDTSGELKRKQPKEFSQTSPFKKLKKKNQGNMQPSSSNNHSSHKQAEREKLDFNVLVPKKSHGKKKKKKGC